jgi:hypothetical protein
MPAKESEDTVRVHVHLYKADVDKLHLMFDQNPGFSKAIRTLVRKFVRSLQEQANNTQ